MSGVTAGSAAGAVLRYAAFTRDPAGGNPAGVVLDAAGLDEAEMQRLAAQVGYSETAFLTPSAEGDPRSRTVRYFSPAAEVPFCGHATIASSVALAERLGPGPLLFATAAGEVPVLTTRLDDGSLLATLTSVAASVVPAADGDVDEALAALRWVRDDLDPSLPPAVAYAGAHHLVLAAISRERLADLDYDVDRLRRFCLARGLTTVHLVWRQSADRYHARDPFPVGGVVEDPATGAAAAAFGAYLRHVGAVQAPARITLHQGHDMGRPSTLHVELMAGDARVQVSGSAVAMAAAPERQIGSPAG